MRKIFVFIYLIPFISFSQKIINNHKNAWISYFGNHRLSNKFGVHTEYQWRRADGFQNWQQSLLRFGIDYNASSNLIATAG